MDRKRLEDGPRHRRVRERGAGFVELALAAPVLVSLLLGTVTSALALNDDLQLTHAAREGARYGAAVPAEETFSSGTWADNVRDVVVERFGDDLDPTAVCVALVTGSGATPISAAHTTNSDGTGCYLDGSGMTDARVQVTISRDASIDTGFYSHDLELSSEATAMHESNG